MAELSIVSPELPVPRTPSPELPHYFIVCQFHLPVNLCSYQPVGHHTSDTNQYKRHYTNIRFAADTCILDSIVCLPV